MIKSGSLHHMVKQGQVTGRVNNKPVVTKGGQNFLLIYFNCISRCEYMQRKNIHRKSSVWVVMGNIEVNNIMGGIKPMI